MCVARVRVGASGEEELGEEDDDESPPEPLASAPSEESDERKLKKKKKDKGAKAPKRSAAALEVANDDDDAVSALCFGGGPTAVERTRKENANLGAGARRSGFFAGKQKPNTTIADEDAGEEPTASDESGLSGLVERSHDDVEKAARHCIDGLDLEAAVDKGDDARPSAEAVLDGWCAGTTAHSSPGLPPPAMRMAARDTVRRAPVAA